MVAYPYAILKIARRLRHQVDEADEAYPARPGPGSVYGSNP